MGAVAFAAIVLWLLRTPGGVFFSLGFAGLVLAFTCWAGKPKRAPSAEFLCASIAAITGFLLMPAKINWHPTNDIVDFGDLLWLIGSAAAGALIGAIVGWADRRILGGR
jgi:hypothetical protein